MFGDSIFGYVDDDGVGGIEFCDQCVEVDSFGGVIWCIVFGIEIEYDIFVFQGRKIDGCIIIGGYVEIWSQVVCFEFVYVNFFQLCGLWLLW